MKYLNWYKRIFIKKNSGNDVFKNMGILALGAGGAQIIGIAATPILTRIYSPENFGVLAIFMSAVGLIGPFMTMRYVVPLPLLKNDGLAINLFAITIIFLVFFTLLSLFSLTFYSEIIFNFFSINVLVDYWLLVPFAIFTAGLFEILNSWSIRQKNFKAISKTNVFQVISSSLSKIGLGILEFKSIGLLVGTIFSSAFAAFMLLLSNYSTIKNNIKHIRKKRIIFLLKYYIEYPKYRLPSQFLLVVSRQAPLLFLAAFFGSDIVGYFALTMTTLSLPFALFGNTTGQAYYAEISKIGRKNPVKIYEVTKDVIQKLFFFSIIPFLILLIFSPWVFSIVFGENWMEAGIFTSLMSFYMLSAFISAPLANALSVFENQLMFLKLNIIRLIVLFGVFSISWLLSLDARETILFYSIGMSLYFIYLSYYIMKTIKSHMKGNENAI